MTIFGTAIVTNPKNNPFNTMKSYLRFLSRNKLYTAIMAVGLSVALALVIPWSAEAVKKE